MRDKKWTSYWLLIFFAIFIWGYSLVDIFIPDREYSELENRKLQHAPVFSARALFNNTYTIKFEEFTNDQFMLRDAWITMKSLCETALLKIENNGISYGRDFYMFEKRPETDAEQLRKNTDSLLTFAGKFPGQSMTLMLVPTSDMILTELVPKGLNNIDQKPLIQNVYDEAGAKMRTVDLFAPLNDAIKNNPNSYGMPYLYYRTDHHWTTNGAQLAYNAYANLLNPGADRLNPGEPQTQNGFYGTYYSKAKLFNAVPDTIEYYEPIVKSVMINDEAADGIYDMKKFAERDKYAAFLHSNNAVTVIESDSNQNHKDGVTSRVLLFKDSFGNSFAPFLCYSFDEVTVVDLRYFTEVEKLVSQGNYDEILFLYSFPSFSQETSLVNLKL